LVRFEHHVVSKLSVLIDIKPGTICALFSLLAVV
jgi:hypothetical protein